MLDNFAKLIKQCYNTFPMWGGTMDVEILINQLLDGDTSYFAHKNIYEVFEEMENIKLHLTNQSMIDRIFKSLVKLNEFYAFLLVYTCDKYEKFCRSCLNKKFYELTDLYFLGNFLEQTDWASRYVEENFDKFLTTNNYNISIIVKYAIKNNKEEWMNILINNKIDYVRIITMSIIINNYPFLFRKYYKSDNDLLNTFAVYDENNNIVRKTNEESVSKIAIEILKKGLDIEIYEKIKNFILREYQSNTLARRLCTELDDELKSSLAFFNRVFLNDINELFITSKDYKWELYTKYGNYLSPFLFEEFDSIIKPFVSIKNDNVKMVLEDLSKKGLLDNFLSLTTKYLELSTESKVIRYLTKGSCATVFLVGDYVIKYSPSKHDDKECPNIYLVIKNLEEKYQYDDFGTITGAIEVQKYLSKPVIELEMSTVFKWCEALNDLGYRYGDILVNGPYGSNMFYLNDYHDADTNDPENLPEWFKENPIVLIDRDMVEEIKDTKQEKSKKDIYSLTYKRSKVGA